MKLGKQAYVPDPRTVKLARVMDSTFPIPSVYNFDKGRRPFPASAYGNLQWGDCVMAGRTNHLIRLERVETRRTPRITDRMVVKRYLELTGGEDTGLVVLEALRDWRSNGWDITTSSGTRHYTIDAFGELQPDNPKQLRQAIYLLHGIQLGFQLPASAEAQTEEGYWEVSTEDNEPGSWGGHLVYSHAYDYENVYVWSWGKEIKVSEEFVNQYCDEAWAVVDSLDKWREALDVDKLMQILRNIGASSIEH